MSNLTVATACVALRAELLASVPLNVYRTEPDGSRARIEDHPLTFLLGEAPNWRHSSFEAREILIRNLDIFGNAYAKVERGTAGEVAAIWPLMPRWITVERLANSRLRYAVAQPGQSIARFLENAGEFLHIRAACGDGELGRSPLAIAHGALEAALAAVETERDLMQSSLRMQGVLLSPQVLTSDQRRQARTNVIEPLSDWRSQGTVGLLEAGWKYQSTSSSPKDAQLAELRQAGDEAIARLFRVPPSILGIADSRTYGSAIEESRQLVVNCLAPLAARVERAMERDLLSAPERLAGFYIRHDLEGLLRGDQVSRYQAYRIGREIGVLSANDIRRRENEPPIPNGDTYVQPLNMGTLGAPVAEQGGGS